jgi:predicted DCC family thiol-disulfide oxidoreductase YuxK
MPGPVNLVGVSQVSAAGYLNYEVMALMSQFKMSQLKTPSEVKQPTPGRTGDSSLPSPHDFPKSDVVIFDGNCVFCTGQVENLKRLDGKNRLSFVSLHDPFVTEHFPDLSFERMMEQIYVVPKLDSGFTSVRLGGAAALRYLSRRLPKLWILAPALHIPFTLPIWQWCYQQVAKRRYRIAGKTGTACDDSGTCDVHFKK